MTNSCVGIKYTYKRATESLTMNVLCLLLFLFQLLSCVVEVHSQTAPYLTFMGEILPNNSYVDLSLVGQGGNATHDSGREIVCHTDLDTCCSGSDGHGDWFSSLSGFKLPEHTIHTTQHPIAMRRLHKRVRLERVPSISGPIPSGIYHCAIETVAVSGEGGTGRERVYVGLYQSGGMIVEDWIWIVFWIGLVFWR